MNKFMMIFGALAAVFFGGTATLQAETKTVCGASTPTDATSLVCTNGDLAGVAELTSLQKLQVRSELGKDGLAPLAAHPTLEVLDMAGSSVNDDQMKHLEGLPKLDSLNLAGTKVTDKGLTVLASLLVLRRVSLKGTPIDGSGLKHLKGLPFLKWLDLSDTKLTDDAIPQIEKLRSVRELSLDGTDMSVKGVQSLRDKLQNAEIRAVGLGKPFKVCGQEVTVDVTTLICESDTTESQLKKLQQMTELTSLTIRGATLDDRAMRHIRGSNLETIDFTGTSVTDRGLSRLNGLPVLKTINLSKTKVTDEGLMELTSLGGLQEIFVAGTAVTAGGEAKFRRAKSGVRVVR